MISDLMSMKNHKNSSTKLLLAFLTAIFSLIANNSYAAGVSNLYNCPDLQNKEKSSIATMTQGLDGWFFRESADLKDEYRLLGESKAYLTNLAKAFANRGTSLVVAVTPTRGIAGQAFLDKTKPAQKSFDVVMAENSFNEYIKMLNDTGVIAPNLAKPSQQKSADGTYFFLIRDHHWSADGAKMAALTINDAIKNNAKYKTLTKKKYTTAEAGIRTMKEIMGLELQKLCTSELPADKFMSYKTSLVDSGSADDLFGDGGGEPSVLIGSSFSALKRFNFDGFLSEATGLEIANHALSAGGLFNAIISYTASKQFTKSKPPFLFWEVSGVEDINNDTANYFRQIIPAIYGECGDKAITTNKINIKNGAAQKLISASADKKISGDDYYMFLDASNRGLAKFTLQIDYDDGDGEWFTLDRSEHFKNEGRFFIELNSDIESNVTDITIDAMDNINTDLEIAICKKS